MAKLSGKDISELRGRAQGIETTLQMGKAGMSQPFLEELDDWLQDDDLVKVRLLRSARSSQDKTELAEAMAEATGAVLVEVRGNTAVLYRP